MKSICSAAVFLSALLLAGCGKNVDGRLPTYKVIGTVKYKGQLLEGADVILQFPAHTKASFARTNSSGEFRLGTYEKEDGALAGEAFITVTKWEQLPPSNALVAGDPGYDPNKAYTAEKEPKLLVPQKYSDFKTSGLKVVIEAKNSNDRLNIELED
jgi:hypothetical protein